MVTAWPASWHPLSIPHYSGCGWRLLALVLCGNTFRFVPNFSARADDQALACPMTDGPMSDG